MEVQRSPIVCLSPREAKELRQIARRGKSENRMVMRARIVLAAWEGRSITEIGRLVGTSPGVVRKWLGRFRKDRIEGLRDRPRSGRPDKFTPQQRLRVIEVACQSPEDFGRSETRWSISLLCETLNSRGAVRSMSRSTVHRILEGGAIKPHRVRTWENSHDPQFQPKAEAILDLYHNRRPGHTVLCFDEKPGIQANERMYPSHPLRPGKPERAEFHYRRHGTRDLLAFFNPKFQGCFC